MTDDHLDSTLVKAFGETSEDLTDDAFVARVMSGADGLKRSVVVRRIGIGLGMALVGIPLQDYALVMSQVMVLSLIEMDDRLLAQVLAPVNTVGTLLSLVILGLRIVYKRIFS